MDDEAPQVVVLRKSHLSLDQVQDAVDSGARGVVSILHASWEPNRLSPEGRSNFIKNPTANDASCGVVPVPTCPFSLLRSKSPSLILNLDSDFTKTSYEV